MNVGKIDLKNPLILASGILGSTGSSLNRIAKLGAGAVVTKSIGATPREGHPGPVLIKTDTGFLNAIGLPNPSYKYFIEELNDFNRYCPLIISVFGANRSELVKILKNLEEYADAFELNLSCPNVKGYGMDIGKDPIFVENITREIKKITNKPLWVKLTSNVEDITKIGVAAENGGADAVVAINTVKGLGIDTESGYPLLGNVYGGLSGRMIRPIGLISVYSLYKKLKIPIIGVGGIENYKDAIEYFMAGARAVEIGSGVYNNINIFNEIKSELDLYLNKKGIKLEELIGLAHRRETEECNNQKSEEREQRY
ncbi:MAG: dihydroorotate dehydrogenase [Candidatus Methanoliparum thermophilum]|uniref:Dihydroorotate dehydrogenase n=1 Tax=Methanoliparum thermophilum TaxID=2491083 RepID=A0A520KRJ4_METT2|nr:dihydroorotate dehydrogenase [Candidatus Methanoliparum sp. LAM-1]RZN64307.1 MAG: dihydroorotate dehydrogenase [Candidatus Methanoliparum thermophilum]BDC35566.1 dihydroorotate dehydrogenase [Candidatus Methanoliparum sp. LAM-1]